MAARLWPAILVPTAEDWMPRGGSRTGGPSFLGSEQIVASPTMRMKASLTIPCITPAKVLAMRSVIAQGRSASWLVGPCEATRLPWRRDPLTGGALTDRNGIPGNADADAGLSFILARAAALNATELEVTRLRGGIVREGQVFSIAGRLHVIVGLGAEDTGAAARLRFTIRPWLREAAPAGATLEFRRPLGTMRLASDDTGAMQLQLSRFGTVSVDLDEAF